MAALTEAVGEDVRRLSVRIPSGGRAAGLSAPAVDEAVRHALSTRVSAHRDELVEKFRSAESRQREAVQGLADVVVALRRAQVEHLLLHDDPLSNAMLWVGEEPVQIASTAQELTDIGVARPTRTRADVAIIWSLLSAGGELTLLEREDQDLTDGIGAILRWSDRSTPHDHAPSMPGRGAPAHAAATRSATS